MAIGLILCSHNGNNGRSERNTKRDRCTTGRRSCELKLLYLLTWEPMWWLAKSIALPHAPPSGSECGSPVTDCICTVTVRDEYMMRTGRGGGERRQTDGPEDIMGHSRSCVSAYVQSVPEDTVSLHYTCPFGQRLSPSGSAPLLESAAGERGCQNESMKKAIVSSPCTCPGNRNLYMQESQPEREKTHIKKKRGRIGRKNKERTIRKWVLFKCYMLLGFFWPKSSTPHTRALFQNLPTLAAFEGIIMLSQGKHHKASLHVVQLIDNPRIHFS
ncbi:hypothetical protein DPX16_12321 [Anabarilius grahami]|uniref:Uncharacterized protein n=1 Tax=Anabarilius grahami TaxID=495550 RepID=A0A3N0XFT4_ANAGA|nr:hypothetical protein DPX16_12321 [Anabarilius grahami]